MACKVRKTSEERWRIHSRGRSRSTDVARLQPSSPPEPSRTDPHTTLPDPPHTQRPRVLRGRSIAIAISIAAAAAPTLSRGPSTSITYWGEMATAIADLCNMHAHCAASDSCPGQHCEKARRGDAHAC